MRTTRLAALVSLVLLLAAPASAQAAEVDNLHGLFTTGTGVNSGETLDLDAFGSWNVVLKDEQVMVTGSLSALHGPCVQQPCEFTVALKWIPFTGGWDQDLELYVFTASDWQTGPVTWDFTFTIDRGGTARLHADVVGCPYGGQSWTIEGVVLS